MALSKELKLIKRKNGIYPISMFFQILLVPLHGVNFSFLIYLSKQPQHELYEQMSSFGMLWFPNILIPDPTGLIPICCAASQVLNMWLMKK